MTTPSRFIALALRTARFAINSATDAELGRPRMIQAIAWISDQMAALKRFAGADVRLVVLPEYFLTGFQMGEVVLRYRRRMSLFAPSQYDVWDRYISHHGTDGVFPVAETELGRISAIASEEILYPDIARAMALRSAEIFLHSSSEIASPITTPKNIAKQARAIENLAYVVSANSAGIQDIAIPAASTDGSSKVVDFHG